MKVVKLFRCFNVNSYRVVLSKPFSVNILNLKKEIRKESNVTYSGDPDSFGTLTRKVIKDNTKPDEGDLKEERFTQYNPMKSQKLTIKQYADIIKQYINHKRLKEAIDVLEVRMIKEDRVKPENYIYNILIGACADVGYTKKAVQLFNDMKRRALKPTGDTYTCLFEACTNSPWQADGLKNAKHLKELMQEKHIEPNLTNYNAMIKAFGKCGDIVTAFQIIDEMIAKKIKIRVHTFNHLLHACISDKTSGLRHALLVWRKMLKMREKPNIFSFNLMLKCVKECNIGSKDEMQELIGAINEHILIQTSHNKTLAIDSKCTPDLVKSDMPMLQKDDIVYVSNDSPNIGTVLIDKLEMQQSSNEVIHTENKDVNIQLINKKYELVPKIEERVVPNLLSKNIKLNNVLMLQEVHTLQEKFALIGGMEDFLKEMESYSVKPDIKTFTQMLPIIEDTNEAEQKLIEAMKANDIIADIDFYNMLIKKRCLRLDYDGAFEVKSMILEESKLRKKKYPMKKKLKLSENIMTYGVLAMACKTKDTAEKLLNEMKSKQLKINVQILGALLKQATYSNSFGYIVYIMNTIKAENILPNEVFLKQIEAFNDKCTKIIEQSPKEQIKPSFVEAFQRFIEYYKKWLSDVNVEEVLKYEHPWEQFRTTYPETVQRQKFEIKEPKKFYKRSRKYVPYIPKI